MSTSLSKSSRQRGEQVLLRVKHRQIKARLLASTSVLATALMVASPATANDATVGGVPIPIFPGFNQSPVAIWVPLPLLPTVVNVNTESLSGPFNAIWVTGSIADTTVSVLPGLSVTSTAGWGTAVSATTGNIAIDNQGTINGFLHAIYAPGLTGATTINSAGVLTSITQDGILATTTSGNIFADGKGTGSITAAFNGVEANTASFAAGEGLITVQNFTGGITGGIDGISANFGTGGTLGDVLITNNGDIAGTLRNGVETYTSGNTTITGNGDITGAINGIAANFAWASPGDVTISGNGDITGGGLGSGIVAGTGTGNIDISANGTTTGGTGIWAVSSLGGNINVTTDKNVTGTTVDGILAQTNGDGTIKVDVTAGDVTGLRYGIDTINFGTGNTTVNIAAGSTVMGSVDGVATGTVPGSGVATTNNAGIIKNTNDTGAANTNGAFAYFAYNGDNVLNNDGQVIGGIFTNVAGSAIINNNADGVWTPIANIAVNAFTANDTLNNAGLINVRTGITTFNALGSFNNNAGGVIDMTYGGSGAAANAKDSLNVFNFSPKAGSKVKFDVDFTQANSAGTEALVNDHSSNGLGTADTIVVYGKGTPAGVSLVDLKAVGSAKAGTSGSIALVNAVPGGLADPGLGGFATMVASSKYQMVTDLTTGAVVYRLVDDKNGGVYLQWAPNLSASSLGGFGGALGDGASSSPGSAIAGVAGAFAGAGGLGNGGGPTGGGVAGRVADMAAGGVLQADDIGQSDRIENEIDAEACQRARHAWIQGDTSRSNFDGGGNGRSTSFSGGVELGRGQIEGSGCNRVAAGIFGFTGDSDTSWLSGAAESDNTGTGAYIRASTALGFYGSLLGAWSWADTDLINKIYGTNANKDSDGFTGVATLGYVARITERAAFDFRSYVAYGDNDGDAFTDSAGISVSGTNDDLTTVGGSVGLHFALTNVMTGFVRGGVKWSEVNSEITSFGVTQNGSANETSGSAEAGFVAKSSENIEFGASGFGESSSSTTSYGGRAHVGVKF